MNLINFNIRESLINSLLIKEPQGSRFNDHENVEKRNAYQLVQGLSKCPKTAALPDPAILHTYLCILIVVPSYHRVAFQRDGA